MIELFHHINDLELRTIEQRHVRSGERSSGRAHEPGGCNSKPPAQGPGPGSMQNVVESGDDVLRT